MAATDNNQTPFSRFVHQAAVISVQLWPNRQQ